MQEDRQQLVDLINEAVSSGAKIKLACNEAEISFNSYKRWNAPAGITEDKRSQANRSAPSNKLSKEEVQAILETCNQPEYSSLPPSQIVPRLSDKGIYLASESSFYRILKSHKQLNHRGLAKPRESKRQPTTHVATGPKQVFSWDITYLPSRVKGIFYYLYLFEDIFSKKIVGYEVYEEESSEHAATLLQRTIMKEQCFHKANPLILHSDNGAPMKSQILKAKMEEMGVLSSYSRPRVSNDNPYSEALFRTLKYRPTYPSSGFSSLEDARKWVEGFVNWYNHEHRHSSIGFVTPDQKHKGEDLALMERRKTVYAAAKGRNPKRWSGKIRNWAPVTVVTLNPEKEEVIRQKLAA